MSEINFSVGQHVKLNSYGYRRLPKLKDKRAIIGDINTLYETVVITFDEYPNALYHMSLDLIEPITQPKRASDLSRILTEMSDYIHAANREKGWYSDPETGDRVERNIGEMLALIHSEISEALEAHRKLLMDDKIPDFHGLTAELGDAIIRIWDLIGYKRFLIREEFLGEWRDAKLKPFDLGAAVVAKIEYNAHRKDHTLAERAKADGKRF